VRLLDVNVWLAAAWGRHARHPVVVEWFSSQEGRLVMCRVTQMSLMRLLTMHAVLGEDAVTRAEAWRVVADLLRDDRIEWADEPTDLDAVWKAISARADRSHKLWADDYLAAFAQASGLDLVTLDRQLAARYPSIEVITLG
jgi:uncharacterized protein